MRFCLSLIGISATRADRNVGWRDKHYRVHAPCKVSHGDGLSVSMIVECTKLRAKATLRVPRRDEVERHNIGSMEEQDVTEQNVPIKFDYAAKLTHQLCPAKTDEVTQQVHNA